MNIIIFTEGGNDNGFGHISRCSALYDEIVLRGLNAKLIVNTDLERIEMLSNKEYEIADWLSLSYLERNSFDQTYCIIDSYIADIEVLEYIKLKSVNCMYIDDYNRLNYPKGITLTPALIKESSVKNNENELSGPDYIILRKEFTNKRERIINEDVKKVLVTLGGSDAKGLTEEIIKKVIPHFPLFSFDIVLGNGKSSPEFIDENRIENVNIINNASAYEMKELMIDSDFSITAAGQTVYELTATNTPFIPIKTAENQQNNINGLFDFNVINCLIDSDDPFWIENLLFEINRLKTYDSRLEFYHRSNGLIDGRGCKRIVDRLLK